MVEIVRKHIKQFSFQTFRDKETILICCIYLPKLFRKKFQKPFEFRKFEKKTFDILFFIFLGPLGPKTSSSSPPSLNARGDVPPLSAAPGLNEVRSVIQTILKSFIKYNGKKSLENYKSFYKYAYIFLFLGPKQGGEIPHPLPHPVPTLKLQGGEFPQSPHPHGRACHQAVQEEL